jgi:hypothetical protein
VSPLAAGKRLVIALEGGWVVVREPGTGASLRFSPGRWAAALGAVRAWYRGEVPWPAQFFSRLPSGPGVALRDYSGTALVLDPGDSELLMTEMAAGAHDLDRLGWSGMVPAPPVR